MLFLKRSAPASLLVSLLIFTSCTAPAGNSSSANENQGNRVASVPRKANDKPEELGMLINFTVEPEDIVWQQSESPKRIVAVFRLEEEDTKKFADQLKTKSPGAARSVTVEDWFPAELIAGGETTGGSSVDGTAFPADDFFQAPFTQGTITRINDTDFFVLELTAP
jgi:hypothetical protein